MSDQPRVLIAHSWIQSNLGDILMALELARFIGIAFPDVLVYSAVNTAAQAVRMSHLAHHYGVRLAGVLSDTRSPDLALGFDVVLSTGGDFLTGQWAITNSVIEQLDVARAAGIPTALCFQTIGPYDDPGVLRELAALPDLIIARESATMETLASAGRIDDVVLSADLAFLIEPALAVTDGGLDRQANLGVNFRGYLQTYDAEQVEALAKEAGLPIRGYSTDVEMDLPVLLDLAERGWAVETAGYDYRALAQVIAGNDELTVTDRYHGLVFSILAAVPCISVVSYGNPRAQSHKARGLLETVDLRLPLLATLDEPRDAIETARQVDPVSLRMAGARLRSMTMEGLEALRLFLKSAL